MHLPMEASFQQKVTTNKTQLPLMPLQDEIFVTTNLSLLSQEDTVNTQELIVLSKDAVVGIQQAILAT